MLLRLDKSDQCPVIITCLAPKSIPLLLWNIQTWTPRSSELLPNNPRATPRPTDRVRDALSSSLSRNNTRVNAFQFR